MMARCLIPVAVLLLAATSRGQWPPEQSCRDAIVSRANTVLRDAGHKDALLAFVGVSAMERVLALARLHSAVARGGCDNAWLEADLLHGAGSGAGTTPAKMVAHLLLSARSAHGGAQLRRGLLDAGCRVSVSAEQGVVVWGGAGVMSQGADGGLGLGGVGVGAGAGAGVVTLVVLDVDDAEPVSLGVEVRCATRNVSAMVLERVTVGALRRTLRMSVFGLGDGDARAFMTADFAAGDAQLF